MQTLQDLYQSVMNDNNKQLIIEIENSINKLFENFKEQDALTKEVNKLFENLLKESVPTPPKASDYTNEDGILDEAAYRNAYKEYDKAKEEYDNKQKAVNRQASNFYDVAAGLKNQAKAIVFNATALAVQDKINKLNAQGKEDEAKELEVSLKKLRNSFHDAQKRRKILQNRINIHYERLNNLTIPTLPNTYDYRKGDGTLDEYAYQTAFEEYEKQKEKYDSTFAKIMEEIDETLKEIQKTETRMKKYQKALQDLL